jgi:hypothetical protein
MEGEKKKARGQAGLDRMANKVARERAKTERLSDIEEKKARMAEEALARQKRILDLDLTEGDAINIRTEEGVKRCTFQTLGERGYLWVKGLNPIHPEGAALCDPFDVEKIVEE